MVRPLIILVKKLPKKFINQKKSILEKVNQKEIGEIMKINNIIITGCSYSQASGVPQKYIYSSLLKQHRDIKNVKNLSWPGQSNDTIIRDIKNEINKGVSDSLF